MASATVSSTNLGGGAYQYDVTLRDTGTTSAGTFWFGWVPGENLMAVAPTNVVSPTGWTDNITHGTSNDGFAIQWLAGAGSALGAGGALSGFQFDSTSTPVQLTQDSVFHPSEPVATSFIYSGAPFSDNGAQFVASVSPVASATAPEPSSILLFVLGLVVMFTGVPAINRMRARLR